jgi:hypothetical protein
VGETRLQSTVAVTFDEQAISLSAVREAASSLAVSPAPEVVFESLVRLCAPLVCDAATASVVTADGTVRTMSWPDEGFAPRPQPEHVVVEFDAEETGDHAAYHGLVSLGFCHPHERHPFVVELLVDRAVANVERARLLETAASRQAAADHLQVALASNREIGVAMGIVMANHRLTDDQAFDLLSRTSQHLNRKLRAIAREVVRTGVLDLPPGVTPRRQDTASSASS